MIETQRLLLRKPTKDDFSNVAVFLQDPEVMYSWEHGFTDEEVQNWLDKNIKRCEEDGCGYLVAIEKETGNVAGAMGAMYNRDLNGRACWEIAYILNKAFWGKGYATEGARACMDYVFDALGADKVYAKIRVHNLSSILVAETIGMHKIEEYVRHYRGTDMPHAVYMIDKNEREE